MEADLDTRLKDAVKERDKLAEQAQRIAGRKEAAEKNLESVRKEIQEKNLDPDTLEETIAQLETAYNEAVVKFEKEVESARHSLSPFLEK